MFGKMLDKLPIEVLEAVLGHAHDRRSIECIAQTCHKLRLTGQYFLRSKGRHIPRTTCTSRCAERQVVIISAGETLEYHQSDCNSPTFHNVIMKPGCTLNVRGVRIWDCGHHLVVGVGARFSLRGESNFERMHTLSMGAGGGVRIQGDHNFSSLQKLEVSVSGVLHISGNGNFRNVVNITLLQGSSLRVAGDANFSFVRYLRMQRGAKLELCGNGNLAALESIQTSESCIPPLVTGAKFLPAKVLVEQLPGG